MFTRKLLTRPENTLFRIHCYECKKVYIGSRCKNCRHCNSRFVEIRPLARIRAPSPTSPPGQKLLITSRGQIVATPRRQKRKFPTTASEYPRLTSVPATATAHCSICLDTIRVGEAETRLENCPHTFHSSCILTWIRTARNNCPICGSCAFTPKEN